jgi:sulfur-oxidizing protein SoxY
MNVIRRKFLKSTALFSATAAAIGAGLLAPGRAIAAYMADAFEASDVSSALKAAVGSDAHTASSEIKLKAPDIAENGAVVPITVSSTLPNVDSITILAPKNPSPMTSTYMLQNGAEAFISTRIKLGKTSDIIAVVRSNGQLFSATKEVKVTIGGCGG